MRDLNKIQSEAYRSVEEIRGVADAKATEIYAGAYNQSPQAVEFYEFTRTMQSYKSIIAQNTTLILSTDSDLFKFLSSMTPDGSYLRRSPCGWEQMTIHAHGIEAEGLARFAPRRREGARTTGGRPRSAGDIGSMGRPARVGLDLSSGPSTPWLSRQVCFDGDAARLHRLRQLALQLDLRRTPSASIGPTTLT